VGAKALRAMVVQRLQTPQVRLTFSSEDVEVPRSGEFAAVRGAYAWTATTLPSDQARRSAGSYIALYRPAGDGRWLVSWLAITPGAPQSAASEAGTPSP